MKRKRRNLTKLTTIQNLTIAVKKRQNIALKHILLTTNVLKKSSVSGNGVKCYEGHDDVDALKTG